MSEFKAIHTINQNEFNHISKELRNNLGSDGSMTFETGDHQITFRFNIETSEGEDAFDGAGRNVGSDIRECALYDLEVLDRDNNEYLFDFDQLTLLIESMNGDEENKFLFDVDFPKFLWEEFEQEQLNKNNELAA